jgi:hypothetical protein
MDLICVRGALGRVKGTKLFSEVATGIRLATEFTGREADCITLLSGITRVKL